LRGEGGGYGLKGSRARGGGFIGAAEGASTCGPGAPHGRRRCHATAKPGVKPESGLRWGTDPIGGARLAVREREREGSGLGC
jgi:hypothetical protein